MAVSRRDNGVLAESARILRPEGGAVAVAEQRAAIRRCHVEVAASYAAVLIEEDRRGYVLCTNDAVVRSDHAEYATLAWGEARVAAGVPFALLSAGELETLTGG